MIKGLLKYSEVNYRHRYELMNAEYENLKNNFDTAVKAYTYAIRYARLNKYIHEEALIWERAGLFFKSQNQPEAAQFYFSNAYKAYAKWGAKGKLEQMKDEYSGFISLEEIVGAHLILFLCRNIGVTSLRSTVSDLLLISHQTTT